MDEEFTSYRNEWDVPCDLPDRDRILVALSRIFPEADWEGVSIVASRLVRLQDMLKENSCGGFSGDAAPHDELCRLISGGLIANGAESVSFSASFPYRGPYLVRILLGDEVHFL
jgi:hypothetical protein